MSEVADLHTFIEAARGALRVAIDGVADRWQEPFLEPEDSEAPWVGNEAWSPQVAVEHTLSGEQLYDAFLTASLSTETLPGMREVITAFADHD